MEKKEILIYDKIKSPTPCAECSEYLSRFAKNNNMSIERAKEQAICKEYLKSYEEELNE